MCRSLIVPRKYLVVRKLSNFNGESIGHRFIVHVHISRNLIVPRKYLVVRKLSNGLFLSYLDRMNAWSFSPHANESHQGQQGREQGLTPDYLSKREEKKGTSNNTVTWCTYLNSNRLGGAPIVYPNNRSYQVGYQVGYRTSRLRANQARKVTYCLYK